MSPAGVVMFYGSDHPKTAQLEIDDDPKLGIVVGTFRTMREAHVLDLTLLPRRLGFFEQQSDSSEINRYALAFLHSFVESVAAKVEPGSREHIDYVPTQVVTEWFRTVFHFGKSSLDGIIYPSTQNPGGHSVVLFANRYDVFLTLTEIKDAAIAEKTEEWILRSEHEKAWLRLGSQARYANRYLRVCPHEDSRAGGTPAKVTINSFGPEGEPCAAGKGA